MNEKGYALIFNGSFNDAFKIDVVIFGTLLNDKKIPVIYIYIII